MLNIFHIDDSPHDIELTRIHLSKMLPEAEFFTFTSAADALQALKKTRCDVIISDFQMPLMDGMAFLKAVRKEFADLPFVFFTGQGNEELAVEAFRSGADDYYAKEESFAHYQRLANCITRLSQAYQERIEYRKTRENLDENRRLLQAVMNASPVGIALLKDREIIWGSQPFYEKFGYTEEEVKHQNARILYFDDQEYQRVGEDYFRQLEKRGFARVDATHRKKDGTAMHTLNLVRPLDTSDIAKGYIVAINDITDLKSAEEQLEFQANLLTNVEQAIIATDTAFNIVYCNPHAEKLYGWRSEEIIGRNAHALLIPEEYRETETEIIQQLKSGKSVRGEYVIQSKAGRHIYVTMSIAHHYDDSGNLIGFIGVSHDISDMKKTERELRETTVRLDLALQSADIGIWDYDVAEGTLSWDHRMYEIYNVDPDQFTPNYDNWLSCLHPDDRERLEKELEEALEGIREYNTQFRIIDKDGTSRYIRSFATVTRDAEGNPLNMVGINYDITEGKKTEQRLIESEENYRKLYDNAPIAIFKSSDKGKMLNCNIELAKILGFDSPAQAIGHLTDIRNQVFLNPADRDFVIEKLKTDGSLKEFEFLARRFDGQEIWLKQDVRITDQRPDGTFNIEGFAIDISLRKQAEAASRDSQLSFRNLIEHAAILGVALNHEGKISFINEYTLELTGWRREEVMGQDWFELFVPVSIREQVREVFNHTVSMQRVSEAHSKYVNEILTRSGEHLTISFTNAPVITAEGDLAGLVSIGIDITERIKWEKELEESRTILAQSEAKYRSYSEHSTVAHFVTDLEGNYLDVNKAACNLLGYKREELLELSSSELDMGAEGDSGEAALANLIEHARYRGIRRLRRKDGSIVEVDLSATLINGDRVMAFAMDITDKQEQKKALEKVSADLKSVNEELEAFTYAVSHDLKAPVRQAAGFSSLLSDSLSTKLREEDARVLDLLQQTIGNMNDMLDDYLRISRTMNQEIKPEPVNLSQIAEDILTEREASEPRPNKEFKIETGLSVSTDKTLITSVLQNLLGNAWKYTANSEQTVIEFGSSSDDGSQIYFVRDNGVGFDVKGADRLFQPFQRLHDDEEFSGSGIGLTIAQRALRRLKGAIWADSEPGVQTTFFFTIGSENENN